MASYSSLPFAARHSSRDHFAEPPSLLLRILSILPSAWAAVIQRLWERQSVQIPRILRLAHHRANLRTVVNFPHLCVLVWLLVLLWGERWVFMSSIAACNWNSWERWPAAATPHHLILLTDPQLVDPHTYIGRPWPLSTFTEMHTDNYMKRSYVQLQKTLHPDTIFLLGDLFDGGREWATRQNDTGDADWEKEQRPNEEQKLLKYWKKHYGEEFWLREYNRFGRIFFKYWNEGGHEENPGQRGRKIIASLPGNHDLGFGAHIKIPVRNRFQTYFGESNRVDVIGNHTFVSVDGVSLSASSTEHVQLDTSQIYGPVEEFLAEIQPLKRRAVARELRHLRGEVVDLQQVHEVIDLSTADFSKLPTLDPGKEATGFPTILLTHVPLYREPGAPCGPHREHWPPAKPPKSQMTPVNPDLRNGIPISSGYQYQNVLSEADSVRLVETIGDVVSVFSGDDHDYCELVHPPNKNSAREITVKSMSWAMGVRKPGFLMVSMWNPVDASGAPIGTHNNKGHGGPNGAPTLETHLCLLPDQLSVFIRYLLLLAFTIIVLLGRAVLTPFLHLRPFSPVSASASYPLDAPLLPTTKERRNRSYSQDLLASSHTIHSSTSSTSSNGSLAPRSTAARTRSVSPSPGGYGLPSAQARYVPPQHNTNWNGEANEHVKVQDAEEGGDWGHEKRGRTRKLTPAQTIVREAWTSIWRVAWLVMCIYGWLAWYG